MPDIPSRTDLAALLDATTGVVPASALGFVRALPDERVAFIYSHPHGMARYVLAASELPGALVPTAELLRHTDHAELQSNPQGAIEWLLSTAGVRSVWSVPVPGVEPATRFWVGCSQDAAPAPDQVRALEALAETSAPVLNAHLTSDQVAEQLRRLELAAGLLPAVLHVLDVRQVFEQLSSISQAALPHDMLTLGLFSDDLATLTMYARTGQGDVGKAFPQPYPAAVTRAWDFDIIDDRAAYPFERDRPPTTLGMRSSLRVPFRFQGRIIGGLGFHSREPSTYTSIDLAVGVRLADHVGVALVHHKLAEEGRRVAKLELLDEFLGTLIDSGDLPEIFGRISAIAGKVLQHDAALLMVSLADGLRARVYASSGFPAPLPEIADVPEELLRRPDWEYDILDDITQRTEPRYVRLVEMGFRSILRLAIRLDGNLAGALVFVSTVESAFKPTDVLIARRIADRMRVTLARDREVQASRRADEASSRASRLEARVRALTDELDARTGYRRVIGESDQWHRVLTQAAQVASTETTVLLLGESGTGKEVVARFLHRGSSRSNGPFIAINCAALPEQLLEAELFGYERGAYTGATQSKPGQLEQAAGGTLFLDEVAEMSPSAQAKFLRVLQEREFQRLGGTRVLRTDVRVVAATNRDLPRAMAQGQFREDLYYRLNVFSIRLPPLRDRKDDVLPLSEAFLSEIGRGLGRPPGGITREARQQLLEYQWPGNVRELRNILERAAILCDGGLITPEHLAITGAPPVSPPPPASSNLAVAGAAAGPAHPAGGGELRNMERAMIEQALQSARFNRSKAAKTLGLTRHQLYLRMRKYDLQ